MICHPLFFARCSPRAVFWVCAALLSMTIVAQAQIPISLASSDGNASTQTAAYGITPSAGTEQFLLTTINPAASLPTTGPSLGTTPSDTNVITLNTYFSLPAGTLTGLGAQDGSGYLSQQVLLTVGSVVHFDYVFLTDEDNTVAYNNDQAFFTVNGAFNMTLDSASQLSADDLNAGSNSPNFNFQSQGPLTGGYTSASYTVPATGDYTFGFGVIDVTTNTVYSGLLIDNLNYSLVPEPRTWTLFLGGLSLLGAARCRRRAVRA